MTEEAEDSGSRMILAVEALPFTQVSTDNADELRRQWLIKEVIQPETPLTKATIQFLDDLFHWQKHGLPEVKVRVVK